MVLATSSLVDDEYKQGKQYTRERQEQALSKSGRQIREFYLVVALIHHDGRQSQIDWINSGRCAVYTGRKAIVTHDTEEKQILLGQRDRGLKSTGVSRET